MRNKVLYATILFMAAVGQSGPTENDSSEAIYHRTMPDGTTRAILLPVKRQPTDYTPVGFMRQPSFIRGSGALNKREHAAVAYFDGDVFPPALMLGYRYGLWYWWDIGLDIGGDKGVFQAFARTRIENLKTRRSEAFFWSNEFSAGYKFHRIDFNGKPTFDDRSLVGTIDNSLAFRIGSDRTRSWYLISLLYVDYDLHSPRRQTDYYLMPVLIGYENASARHVNMFLEFGAAYGINGMEFGDGTVKYEKSWFPVFRTGIALRTGDATAIYYTRETKPLSRGKQPRSIN